MLNNIGELILVQIVYVIILLLILWLEREKKRERIVFSSITAIYASIIGWLIREYFTFGSHPDPGSVFAWSMTTIILPGLLVICAIGIIVVIRMQKKAKR